MDIYALNIQDLAIYIFLMPISIFAGRLIFPIWLKLCGFSEEKLLFSSFLIATFAIVPFIFGTLPAVISGALFTTIAVVMSVINCELLSVFPINFQSTNEVSTVAGILDCATYVGSAIASAVFGVIIAMFGYIAMISSWLVLLLISLTVLIINRRYNNATRG